jgi:uncharacterized protein YdcH (DUF465 family)
MPLESHSLVKEFPEMRERIHEMKMTNNHFMKLFESYDEVEHEVHRIESGAETASDAYLEEIKKKRLKLKDDLFAMLRQAA